MSVTEIGITTIVTDSLDKAWEKIDSLRVKHGVKPSEVKDYLYKMYSTDLAADWYEWFTQDDYEGNTEWK